MPALAKPQVTLPRFVPHTHAGAEAGAGAFLSHPPKSRSEDLSSLAHDARNVLSGLMLYSELIATPGVLNPSHHHYAQELQQIAASAAHLIDKMVATTAPKPTPRILKRAEEPVLPTAARVPLTSVVVTDAAAELHRLQPLLAAVAGPAVRLAVASMPCAGCTALAVEDLTRILTNLVRNAADAMPEGGHIGIAVQHGSYPQSAPVSNSSPALKPRPRGIVLTVSDDGPGIPEALRGRIFDLGFTTRTGSSGWPTPCRGLGLNIVRNLVEAAGGTVRITASHTGGARFEINLPLIEGITSGTCLLTPNSTNPADSAAKGCIECQ